MLKEDFLESYFQYKMDEAAIYAAIPGEEDRPFDNLYKARKILQEILEDEMLKDSSNQDVVALQAVINYQLAHNHADSEENGQAKILFKKALELFGKLSPDRAICFFNQIQGIFNMLGLMYLNAEEQETGMAFLLKAEKIYEKSVDIVKKLGVTTCNNMDHYSLKIRDYSSTEEERQKDPKKYAMVKIYPDLKPIFRFYFEGGIDIEVSEKQFTLTCFYLAQAWAKEKGGAEKAAYYCGITLKRQVDTGDYEAKDWANNSMGLSDYFRQERMYSQALYILFTAINVLPADRHKRTKASLRIMVGNILNDQMMYNITLLKADRIKDSSEKELGELVTYINRQRLKFEGVVVNFPVSKIYTSYDELKTLFKMAMTEYRAALQVYPLDGYVSEHVNVVKEMSRTYKNLSQMEEDIDRKVAMELKRKDLLEPIYKSINPKIYVGLWRVKSNYSGSLYRESSYLPVSLRSPKKRDLHARPTG